MSLQEKKRRYGNIKIHKWYPSMYLCSKEKAVTFQKIISFAVNFTRNSNVKIPDIKFSEYVASAGRGVN